MSVRYIDQRGDVWEDAQILVNEEGREMLVNEVESHFGPLRPLDENEGAG